VTGASSGIGLVTARALAARGIHVITVSRPRGEGAQAAEGVRCEFGDASVRFVPADLAHLAEVRRVADTVLALTPRIDVLVNNAGLYSWRRRATADGWELTFAVNHLAPFALTLLLLPRLLAAPAGRVVTVSSDAAVAGRIKLRDPMSERWYDGWAAYAWSKLANQLFTLELARRLAGTSVSATAVHPGFTATRFGHDGSWMGAVVKLTQRLLGRLPERGAEGVIRCADASELDGVSGAYFVDGRPRPFAPAAYDPEAQRALWALSERLTGVVAPRWA
jgi:retinol dehydrogenase 14